MSKETRWYLTRAPRGRAPGPRDDAAGIRRYRVEAYDGDTWSHVGSVLLPHGAEDRAVEHALVAVGVYAPRGADDVLWLQLPELCALVRDVTGAPLARLFAA